MANIGFSKPYYSIMQNGGYTTPKVLGKGTEVDVTLTNRDPAILYADNGPCESMNVFQGASVSIGIDELLLIVAKDIFGTKTGDDSTAINFSTDDVQPYVGLAFIAKKIKDGAIKYRLVLFYKAQFLLPEFSLTTQGENVEFQTPGLDATVLRADNGAWQYWNDFDTEEAAVAKINTIFSQNP